MQKLYVSVVPPFVTVSQQRVQLSRQRPVHTETLNVPRAVMSHDHDFYELSLVLEGTARHQSGSEITTLVRGHVIVVPPTGVHAFFRPRNLRVTNVYYLVEWLAADLRLLFGQAGLLPLFAAQPLFDKGPLAAPRAARIVTLDEDGVNLVSAELAAIKTENARAAPSGVFLKSALLKALVVLSRAMVEATGTPETVALPRPIWQVIDSIEEWLSAGAPFSASALGKAAGMSPDQLARTFRAGVGLSPRDYFQRRRIQRARLAVLQGDKSLAEIAHEMGFTDSAHFSRLFRRSVGISPRDFRKKFSKDE